ncbi:MAG TPA: hypothetical protein VJ841_04990 [Candidatus Saccharimonadales bacterium]|nr:hypothetical protein [Candidatus Saccharimonadales bacterium]
MLVKKLTRNQLMFIRTFAELNATSAIPQSTLYVLAYLTICTDPEQPSVAIMQALDLSAGSVSMALNMLIAAGFVDRIKRKGERQPYYRINSEGWRKGVQQRIDAIHNLRMFADRARKVAPLNERVAAMQETYALFDEKLRNLFP